MASQASQVLQEMEGQGAGLKRQRLQAEHSLLQAVKNGTVTAQTLEEKLRNHVEAVDADMVRSKSGNTCADV